MSKDFSDIDNLKPRLTTISNQKPIDSESRYNLFKNKCKNCLICKYCDNSIQVLCYGIIGIIVLCLFIVICILISIGFFRVVD